MVRNEPNGCFRVAHFLWCFWTSNGCYRAFGITRYDPHHCAYNNAKLAPFNKGASQINSLPTYFWTDSNIVVHWINRNPQSPDPFVANRVAIIQELSCKDQWNHISGVDNPAALLTRGASTEELIKSKTWWNGPCWLELGKSEWKIITPSTVFPIEQAPLICNLLTFPTITHKSKSGKPIVCNYSSPLTMTTISVDGKEQSLLNKIYKI